MERRLFLPCPRVIAFGGESVEHSDRCPNHGVFSLVVFLGDYVCKIATRGVRVTVVARAMLPDGSLARVEELAWLS